MNTYDVAVIGGGAAGLSAALVLARARRAVVVIDAGQPRNAPAAHLQGFLSRDGMPPTELLAGGSRARSPRYGGTPRPRHRHLHRAAATTEPSRSPSADGHSCPRAGSWSPPGSATSSPDLPGVRERWGRDLLHCPYCHGYEVRDQPLGVLGGTPGRRPARPPGPPVVRRRRLLHPHRHPHSGRARAAGGPGHRRRRRTCRSGSSSRTTRCRASSSRTGRSYDATRSSSDRPSSRTATCSPSSAAPPTTTAGSSPTRPAAPACAGVWVAGNAVNPRAQVITAAGEGSAAAIAINNDLVDEDVRNAVHDFRAGLPA